MTTEPARIRPGIRRLWGSDQRALVQHFQRLDLPTRRFRFGAPVTDQFLDEYAENVLSVDSVVFGAFPDGTLRGVAELRGLLESWPPSAEAALLVEPDWQDEGIGDALLGRLIAASQNRGIKTLHMVCLRDNARMQHLARRHEADLDFDVGGVEARLTPSWPTPMSLFEEMLGDTRSYLQAIFRLPA